MTHAGVPRRYVCSMFPRKVVQFTEMISENTNEVCRSENPCTFKKYIIDFIIESESGLFIGIRFLGISLVQCT